MPKKTIFLLLFLVFTQFFLAVKVKADDLILTGSINGSYYSNENIYTEGTCVVEESANAILATPNTIALNSGFSVELGGSLTATIDDTDSDSDGMPDGWEAHYGLNPLVNDASADPDNDSLTNLEEYQNETDPNDSDTDDDGMPDGWEIQNGLDPLVDDTSGDFDSDNLTNLEEYQNETDPNDSDTDDDGMPDGWEVQYSLNPIVNDASGDLDNDGITNLEEYQYQTEPNNDDTDDDGMPDGWEVQYGLDPLVNDASGDPDNDGFLNYDEYIADTDPTDQYSYPGSKIYFFDYDESGNLTDMEKI